MVEFTGRKEEEFHQLPLSKDISLKYPERMVLIFCKGCSTDFGSLCYLRRSDKDRGIRQARRVDLSSFSKARAQEIRALITHVTERFAHSGLTPRTLYGKYRDFVRFMAWCDSSKHSTVLANEEGARAAFGGYVEYLRRLVSQNQIGNNTATRYQDAILDCLQDFLNVENLDRGVNLLVQSFRLAEPTSVPDDASQEKVLAWCKCLLVGFSELVVDQKLYPFSLIVPGYLNWSDNRLWVFPVVHWCESPDCKDNENYRAYDYRSGRVRIAEEIEYLYGQGLYPTYNNSLVKMAQQYIVRSNQDFLSYDRIMRAMLAVKAFLMLFVASTGNNSSQVIGTLWSEEMEKSVRNPSVERQNYRTIKYRANNLIVHFEIGVEYMPYLRRYLELRKYLLNGKDFKYLFFGYGPGRGGLTTGPVPLTEKVFYGLYLTLTRLTPTLPKVVPMQWRAAKQDYAIRNYDPATASRAMQHTLPTALKKYSNGSEVTAQIEISSYLRQVENVVLMKDQTIAGGEHRSLGICLSPKHPQAIADRLPVIPDCKGSEGCLFCDKYRVHADESDVRKLLSARYCVKANSNLASSPEQFGRLFSGVLQRIDFILNEIRRYDEKMVEKIEQEVDIEGELDSFWSAKLEMLMELELV